MPLNMAKTLVKKGDVRTTGTKRHRVVRVKGSTVYTVTSAGSHGRYSEVVTELSVREFLKLKPTKPKA